MSEEDKGYKVVDRRRTGEQATFVKADDPKPEFANEKGLGTFRDGVQVEEGGLGWDEAKFAALVDRIRDDGEGDDPDHVFDGEVMHTPKGKFIPEFMPEPEIPRGFGAELARATMDAAAAAPDKETVAMVVEGATQDEPRPLNRTERRAEAKRAKREAKKLKKLSLEVKDRPSSSNQSPLDMISLMAEVANTCNMCVADCEDLVKRVPGGDRHAASELQMAMQLAFMLGYMDAHGPKDLNARAKIVETANIYRKRLTFKTQGGEIVKPKETALVEAPPSIVPATSLVHLK